MKYNKVLLGCMAITLFMSGSYTTAYAIDFIAKAAIVNKSSELIIRDRNFTLNFITLDLSLTTTYGRYFLTLNNENSIKDAIETDPNGLIFFSRQVTNLTSGYSFDIANVFVGWRTGETDAYYTGENNNFGTKSDGFYIGASKSHHFKDKGGLSGSIAIASLDGEVSLTEPFVDTSAFCLREVTRSVIIGVWI